MLQNLALSYCLLYVTVGLMENGRSAPPTRQSVSTPQGTVTTSNLGLGNTSNLPASGRMDVVLVSSKETQDLMYLLGTLQCVKFRVCVSGRISTIPSQTLVATVREYRAKMSIHYISLYTWRAGRKGFRQAGISGRNSRIVQSDWAGSSPPPKLYSHIHSWAERQTK